MGQRETVTQSSLDSNQSNIKDPRSVLPETDLNTKIYLLFYYILAWILPDQKLEKVENHSVGGMMCLHVWKSTSNELCESKYSERTIILQVFWMAAKIGILFWGGEAQSLQKQ
jgi:hypothetical protein